MKTILIATHNRWKHQLFAPIFQAYGFESEMLDHIPEEINRPEENGNTVVANALIKAHYYHSESHPWVFGDDTGLEIDALNGEPGVRARRWGDRLPENVDEREWLEYLLDRMRDTPVGKRTAKFIDGWALVDPEGNSYTYETQAGFEIATHPIRPIVPGSPIMAVALGLPDDPNKVFLEVKNRWDDWGILQQLS